MKSFWKSFSAIAAGTFLACGTSGAQDAGRVDEKTIQQLQVLETAKLERTPAEKKMSSNLWNTVRQSASQLAPAGAPRMRPMTAATSEKVSVTLKGKITDELQKFIAELGGTDIAALPRRNVLSVDLPLSRVDAVTERPEVNSIDLSAKPQLNQAPSQPNQTPHLQNAEGELAHAAAAARSAHNTDGSHVKVCVMSDSVRHLPAAQEMGSLGEVTVLSGQSGTDVPFGYPNAGEGTAMLEIVHRIAPGAELMFATGNKTSTQMALNIDSFRQSGCHIIVDDLTYPFESPFQDGPIAQSVADASDAGILYFSSSANSGNKVAGTSGTWEGDFKPSNVSFSVNGKPYTFHEFAPGVIYNGITDIGGAVLDSLGQFQVTLFWSDPLEGATNEYQLAAVDANGDVRAHSGGISATGSDPYQWIDVRPSERIAILRAPNAQPRFLHLATSRAQIAVSTGGATQGHNSSGAANAFTVASISARGRTSAFTGGSGVTADNWSSDGPRRMFYDTDGKPLTPGDLMNSGGNMLSKPDITAANCVTTDVPGFSDFCGTSAAAPHAAAIAALVKSAHPTLTPAQLGTILRSGVLDIMTPGWDPTSGMGILMPGLALEKAADTVASAAPKP
jgi:subtilisin family serine protease